MSTFFRSVRPAAALAAALWTAPAGAQSGDIELGVLGLISDYRSVTVANSDRSGDIGPGVGFSGGFIPGQNLGDRWGGEFRYIFFQNDFELTSGGTEVDLDGQSHAIHYDVLYYFKRPDARIRPYVAAGFGLKRFRATGREDPFQPLGDLALLTKTSQTKFMGDFGFGVKFRVGRRGLFRVEFRDYMTGVPKQLLTPAPGAEIDGGVLHQFAPLFGFSWIW